MSCCGGLNQILSLAVPGSDQTEGAALDVSGLVGSKSFELSGTYSGAYTILGSEDGTRFVPLITFNSGAGVQAFKQTTSLVMRFVKVRRKATNLSPIAISVAGASSLTESPNNFVALATVPANQGVGPLPSVDLWTLAPSTGLDAGFAAACVGDFEGIVALEGSLDGTQFSPIGDDGTGNVGGFVVSPKVPGAPVPELSPLRVGEVVRFVRLNILPGTRVNGPVNVAIGGSLNANPSSSAGALSIAVDSINTTGVKLSTFDTSGFIASDSYQAFVGTVGDYFAFRRGSSLTVDGITVIAASGTAGAQWVRLLIQNKKWQSQLTWSVDASNTTGLASDENTGVDDTHPLLTHAECVRRTNEAIVPEGSKMLVRHMSNDPVGSSAVYNIRGGTGILFDGAVPDAISNLFGYFNIIGVPSVVYSGTMGTVVQTAGGVAGDNHFTDATTPAFSNATGRLWKRTTASPCGFWPQKDSGSNVTRVSCAMRTTGRVVLANGNPYSILQLPILRDVTFASPQQGQFPTVIMQVDYRTASTFGSALKIGPSAFLLCDMTGFIGNGVFWGSIGMYNCHNPFVFSDLGAMDPVASILGGLVDVGGGGGAQPPGAGRFNSEGGSGAYISFQGVGLALDHAVDISNLQASFYDTALCVSINIALASSQAKCEITLIGGTGNTGKIVRNAGSASFVTVQTYDAAMTTDGVPFQLNGATSATPNLVDFATKANCVVAF